MFKLNLIYSTNKNIFKDFGGTKDLTTFDFYKNAKSLQLTDPDGRAFVIHPKDIQHREQTVVVTTKNSIYVFEIICWKKVS